VGQTPILRHRYAHDRVSAISGIAVSPKRCHCTLYCHLYEDNIQGGEVAAFLRHLLRQIPIARRIRFTKESGMALSLRSS
jgi:hypothetical protein